MSARYKKWGILSAAIFTAVWLPLAASHVIIMLFAGMGTEPVVYTYLALGPAVILGALVIIFSIWNLFSIRRGIFIATEISLILLILNLVFFILAQKDWNLLCRYSIYGLIYSAVGILQNRAFFKFSLPAKKATGLKLPLILMTITVLISGAALALAIVMAVPKLPPDKRGIKFESGSVQYYDDWRRELLLGQLSEMQEVQGISLPPLSWVYFERSGELSGVQLPPEGAIIAGIKCAGKEWVYFHRSGRMESAALAEDQEIAGKLYLKGTQVKFDENGKLIPAQ